MRNSKGPAILDNLFMDLLFHVGRRDIPGRIDGIIIPNTSNYLFRPSFVFLFLFHYLLIIQVKHFLQILLGGLIVSIRLQNRQIIILFSFSSISFKCSGSVLVFLVRVDFHSNFDQSILQLLSQTIESVALSRIAVFRWHERINIIPLPKKQYKLKDIR